jgi:hypothetical protein
VTRSCGQTEQKTLRLTTASELNSQRSRYGPDIPAVSSYSSPPIRPLGPSMSVKEKTFWKVENRVDCLCGHASPRAGRHRGPILLALPHAKLSIYWVLGSSLMGL